MSTATVPTTSGDFDDEFGRITADYDAQPVRREPSRWVSQREAIDEGLGFRRHRTREREV
jgi:hypothetical protein